MSTELARLWNSNMSLSRAYKWIQHKNLPTTKAELISFWRSSYRSLGPHGSHTIPTKKYKSPKPSRDELISTYSVHTGMFGSYASWLGRSVSGILKEHGYKTLTESEQKFYRCY